MPGFVHNVNPSLKVGIGATRLADLSYVLGFTIAVVMSIVLHKLFPYDYAEVTILEGREMNSEEVDSSGATSEAAYQLTGTESKHAGHPTKVEEVLTSSK